MPGGGSLGVGRRGSGLAAGSPDEGHDDDAQPEGQSNPSGVRVDCVLFVSPTTEWSGLILQYPGDHTSSEVLTDEREEDTEPIVALAFVGERDVQGNDDHSHGEQVCKEVQHCNEHDRAFRRWE